MLMQIVPLLAAMQDWFTVLVPIVFAIIWMLNQLFGKANAPQPRPRPGIPRPNPPPGGAPPRPAQPPANVNQEIENFLRRAAQARSGQPAAASPAPQKPASEPAAPRTLVNSPSARMPSQRMSAPPLVTAEVVEDREGPSLKGTVSEHVQRHLDTRSFAERASLLTRVDNADELMNEHLQQTFEQDRGRQQIGTGPKLSDDQPRVVALDTALSAFLRDPDKARQAVVLHEILARRDF